MSIKIPEQYYMGRRKCGLAFITPDGKDKAAEKRKATVDSWAKQREGEWVTNPKFVEQGNDRFNADLHRRQIYVTTKKDLSTYETFDNTPVSGFKLCKVVGRWSTQNKAFEIEDPRGFRIQIYSNNMVEICQQGGIADGKFIGAYVYGREGAHNVLLPIGSDIYKEAAALTTDVAAPKISIRQLSIGDKVTILYQNERRTCLYVGRNWHLRTEHVYTRTEDEKRRRYNYRSYNGTYHWEDVIGKPKHGFLDLDPKSNTLIEPTAANILTIEKVGFKSAKATKKLLDAYNGPEYRDMEVGDWQKNWGYSTWPNKASVYSLDRAGLKAIVASRKEELDGFVAETVKGTRGRR